MGIAEAMAGRSWIKLYERWLTSPRHAHLCGTVLGTGALLLLVAESMGVSDEDGTQWIVTPQHDGDLSKTCDQHVSDLAKTCRQRVDNMRKTLRQLVEVSTMVQREDGVYGFPNFLKWQRNPSAERMSKLRDKRHSDVTSSGKQKKKQKQKQKQKQKKILYTGHPAGQATPGLCDRAVADDIKATIVGYRQACGIASTSTAATDADIKRIRGVFRNLGYSAEQIKIAAYRQYRQLRNDKAAARKYLTVSTLCRYDRGADNIGRLLEQDHLGEPAGAITAPSELIQIGTDWWLVHPDGTRTPAEPPDEPPESA
jgi:hypothetical protein